MFDETDERWLKIWKVLVTIISCIYALGALIGSIVACSAGDVGGGIGFLILIGGFLGAFLNQALGMLIANVIGNIQLTREYAEVIYTQIQKNYKNAETNTGTNSNKSIGNSGISAYGNNSTNTNDLPNL